MQQNNSLVLVNSVYQLFTAVHMKRTMLEHADLLITDVTPQLKESIPRIQETGLFDRVIYASVQELNQKYAGAGNALLDEGFRQIPQILPWVLSEELGLYDTVYFSNFDPFTRMLACHFFTHPCRFIWYEDGFSTYVIDYLRENRAAINRHRDGIKIREKLDHALLYEPRLAMRGDAIPNFPLPKVDRNDQGLRELLNHIFSYKPPESHGEFIFLEQSFRAEGIRSNDLFLMRECQQAVGPGRFVVKPHPRNPENTPLQLGLTRKYSSDAPWELFLMNEDMSRRSILTVCSNAALTSRIVFGMDLNTVMLYRLFEGKVLWQEDEVLKQYLRRFHKQFAGKNYYVPNTIYELRSILSYLGGNYERAGQSFGDYPRISS